MHIHLYTPPCILRPPRGMAIPRRAAQGWGRSLVQGPVDPLRQLLPHELGGALAKGCPHAARAARLQGTRRQGAWPNRRMRRRGWWARRRAGAVDNKEPQGKRDAPEVRTGSKHPPLYPPRRPQPHLPQLVLSQALQPLLLDVLVVLLRYRMMGAVQVGSRGSRVGRRDLPVGGRVLVGRTDTRRSGPAAGKARPKPQPPLCSQQGRSLWDPKAP